MQKPTIVERFTDNGEHSHWELIDDMGEVLWDSWDAPYSSKVAMENTRRIYKKPMRKSTNLLNDIKRNLKVYKLADLPNEDVFQFVAIYKDGKQVKQEVKIRENGTHYIDNFVDIKEWRRIENNEF